MGRRRDKPLDDLVEVIALMPWWMGVVLAAVSFAGLHHLAGLAVPAPTGTKDLSTGVFRTLVQVGSQIGQYLLPVICLVGAAMSAWRRRVRSGLVARSTSSPAAEALSTLRWQDFERLVGEAFRLEGYRVGETGGGGADGGVDLVLRKGTEQFLVQCKHWRAHQVGVDVVRELYGVMAARGAAGGFVVTSGRYTRDATAFASGRNIQLVDGDALMVRLRKAKASLAAQRQVPAREPVIAPENLPAASAAVSCPTCSSPMVERVARRGNQPGQRFWGCVTYPRCRGTRPVQDAA